MPPAARVASRFGSSKAKNQILSMISRELQKIIIWQSQTKYSLDMSVTPFERLTNFFLKVAGDLTQPLSLRSLVQVPVFQERKNVHQSIRRLISQCAGFIPLAASSLCV
jgi:hypothetical protein